MVVMVHEVKSTQYTHQCTLKPTNERRLVQLLLVLQKAVWGHCRSRRHVGVFKILPHKDGGRPTISFQCGNVTMLLGQEKWTEWES